MPRTPPPARPSPLIIFSSHPCVCPIWSTADSFLSPLLSSPLLSELRLLESGIAAGGAGAVKKAYVLCAMLFSAVSLKTAIENQYFYTTNNIGTSTRGVLSTVRG